MGFKIGKASDTLNEFEVIDQQITQNNGQRTQRSINRTLQEFRFQEKANISMNLDFITNANFRTLKKLLGNRNDLKEGFMLIPIPYQDDAEFTFIGKVAGNSSPVPSLIKKIETSATTIEVPTDAGFSEIAQADYNAIDTFDTNEFELTATANDKRFRVLVDIDVSTFVTAHSAPEIDRLGLLVFGMKSSPVKFYIFNNTTSQWYFINQFRHEDSNDFSTAGFFRNKQLFASFSLPWGDDSIQDDYLDSNVAHFLIEGPLVDSGQISLYFQHIKAFVNSFNVIPDADLAFNFRDVTTVTGRRTTLDFLEI